MSIIQICAAAVAGMLLAVQFKAQKPEYGIYISIALSLLLFCTRENRNNRGSNTKNRYIYIG